MAAPRAAILAAAEKDRKSTRLNSSHLVISYAVFCLKKKNTRYALCEWSWNQSPASVHALSPLMLPDLAVLTRFRSTCVGVYWQSIHARAQVLRDIE